MRNQNCEYNFGLCIQEHICDASAQIAVCKIGISMQFYTLIPTHNASLLVLLVKRTFGIRKSNSVGFLLLPHERRLLRNLSDGAFYPHLIRASPLTLT